MADMQTRLREAMRAEGEKASPERLRPLRPLSERTVRRRARTRGWLVPAAAAMAIVAVIALVTVGVHTATSRPSPTVAPTVGKPPWPVAGTGRPAYFAAFGYVLNSHERFEKGTYVMIHSSATGDVLSTAAFAAVNVLGYGAITAAGDDRHFLVELPTGSRPHPVWRFWWLVVSADGRHVAVSPLKLPAGPADMDVSSIALSADGTRLAVAWATPPPEKQATGITSALQVINLPSGTAQTWTTRQGNIRFAVGTIGDVSWGSGDRLLGFSWQAGWAGSLEAGYYLLDTGNPRAGLLSRRIIDGWAGGRYLGDAFLAGAAQDVIAAVALPVPGKKHLEGNGDPAIVEFSARTGQIVRTLYGPGPYGYGLGWRVLSIDPSGQHVLAGVPTLVLIDDGTPTPVRVPGRVNNLTITVNGAW
ncbi:MAG TPA: hypothetical protein VGH27_25710 [Streptosporangiaceae bacterium]|jgi:hypothetical protein